MTTIASILSAPCEERHGTVTRHVYPVVLDAVSIQMFWNKMKPHRTLFSQDIQGDFKKFMELFVDQDDDYNLRGRGLIYRVDDFIGCFYITNIYPELDALVHLAFFDYRLRGRELLAKEMIKYAFRTYKFKRLSVEIPKYVKRDRVHKGNEDNSIFGFVERIGFLREGVRRRSILFDSKYFDIVMYGMLDTEALGTEALRQEEVMVNG